MRSHALAAFVALLVLPIGCVEGEPSVTPQSVREVAPTELRMGRDVRLASHGHFAIGSARLRTESVRVGARELLAGGAVHRRSGESLERVFDRVVEELRPHVAGVEQRWRFDTRPDGVGDLRVSVAVAGGDLVASSARGLAIRVDGVVLTYGRGTWIDADGSETPIVPEWRGERIELTVPEAVLGSSAYPAVLDPVIGTLVPVETPSGVTISSTGDSVRELVTAPDSPTREVLVTLDGDYWLYSVDTTSNLVSPNRKRLDAVAPEVACTSATRCAYFEDRTLEFFDAESLATVATETLTVNQVLIEPTDAGYTILIDDAAGRRFHFYDPDGVELSTIAAPAYDRTRLLVCHGAGCVFSYSDASAVTHHRTVAPSGLGPEQPGVFGGIPWGTADGYVAGVNAGTRESPMYQLVFYDQDAVEDTSVARIDLGGYYPSDLHPIPGGAVLLGYRMGTFVDSQFHRRIVDASGSVGADMIAAATRSGFNRNLFRCISATECTLISAGSSGDSPLLSRLDLTGDLYTLTALGNLQDRYATQQLPAVTHGGGSFGVAYAESGTRAVIRGLTADASGPRLPAFELGTNTDTTPNLGLVHGNGVFLAAWGVNTLTRRFDDTGTFESSASVTSSYDFLAVGSDGTNFLTVLDAGTTSQVMTMNALGAPLMATPVALPAPAVYGAPSVTFGAGQYFVTWAALGARGNDIFGMRVSTAGELLDTARIPISSGDLHQTNPVAAFDGTDYQVYWEDQRDGGSVRMNRVRTDGSVVDLVGTRVDDPTVPRLDGTRIRVAHDGTDAFLLYGTEGSSTSSFLLMLQRLRGSTRVEPPVMVHADELYRTYDDFAIGTAGDGRSLIALAVTGIAPYQAGWVHVLSVRNDASGVPCTGAGDCATGFCVSGVCCDTACTGGCETCLAVEGAPVDGTCGPRTAGHECRASTGACDPAESCDGTATSCPAESAPPAECLDGGTPDAFAPEADAFVSETDAFVPGDDAGGSDSGMAGAFDGGSSSGDVDGGSDGDGGGGCAAGGAGSPLGFGALGLLLVGLRRRRPRRMR